jgi:uncharacterized protein (DUF486 family)
MRTILLLTISNIFMTFAWYGHLKFRSEALWKVIMVSWGIAFFEYCFQVPANRIGSYQFSAAQLKTIQEIITLSVFSVFSVLYLGDKFRWNYGVGFVFIAVAAFFIFHRW